MEDTQGNSGNAARSSSGTLSSSAAADMIAAAVFTACVANGQVELAAGRPAPTCGFIPNAAANPAAPAAPPAPAIDPGVLARQALLQLPIPSPEAQVGPPPSINEWNMAAVGYPLWLWTDDPTTHTMTVTEQGIALTLQATRRTTRFDLGDGARVFCGLTTPWHQGLEPGTPSPSCGHTYQQPSPAGGTYAITATTVWDITWTALGQTGTLEFERTGPVTPLPVGELHALRTG